MSVHSGDGLRKRERERREERRGEEQKLRSGGQAGRGRQRHRDTGKVEDSYLSHKERNGGNNGAEIYWTVDTSLN